MATASTSRLKILAAAARTSLPDWKPVPEAAERNAYFHSRQLIPNADMRAGREGQVRKPGAGRIELVRFGPTTRITVSSVDRHIHHRTGGQHSSGGNSFRSESTMNSSGCV
jgi:hypothetical protein